MAWCCIFLGNYFYKSGIVDGKACSPIIESHNLFTRAAKFPLFLLIRFLRWVLFQYYSTFLLQLNPWPLNSSPRSLWHGAGEVCVCNMGVVSDPVTPQTWTPVGDTESPLCLHSPLSVDYHDNAHSYHGWRLIIQLHTVNYLWTGCIVLERCCFFSFKDRGCVSSFL